MISYEPLWATMKIRGISSYRLIKYHKINSNTLTRMRKNQPISTQTLDDLYEALDCNVEFVMKHIPNETKATTIEGK